MAKNCPRFLPLYWFASYWGLGRPLHPRGKISTVPKWSRARIPGWSRPGPCQRPWFFLDVLTFSAGFLGCSKVLVRFTHAFHAFFGIFSRNFSGFSRWFCGFLRFSTLFSKVFSRSFSSMRSARASFFCSFLALLRSHSARVPVEATWQGQRSCV